MLCMFLFHQILCWEPKVNCLFQETMETDYCHGAVYIFSYCVCACMHIAKSVLIL